MRKLGLILYFSLLATWVIGQLSPFTMPNIDFTVSRQQLLDARSAGVNISFGGTISTQWNTPAWESNYSINNVTTRLTLQIANERNTLTQDWDITVPILLTVYDEAGNVSHTSTQNLSVFYKHAEGTQYKEIDLKEIEGGYKFTAEILVPQVTSTNPSLINSIFKCVDITASILHERVNDFDPNYQHTWGHIDIDRTNVLTKGVVVICWDEIPGATSYDLEWTYAESYDSPPGLIGMTGTTVSFNENSSRVSLSDLCYSMPIVYEKGLLLYRVRGKGYNKDNPNQLLTGKWSCSNPYNNCPSYDNISPFEWYSSVGISTSHEGDNKNWQAVTSYAEEGKRKDVVTYMDGTLRSRQTTTLINSDQNALVAETIYDHQGRPAIQTLPAPVWKDMQLKFRQNFNQNTTFKPYSKLDFDVNPATCGQDNVAAMNEAQGASLYYSRNLYQVFNTGDVADKPHLAYIPEAFGYPFVQTEYTADNTGRIARQGGAGKEFQLGSGHETKYFYGVPAQEELDLLFGTNVGIANHYKKNMVVDPNGQSSVSYMDAKGNTIATALAGEAPKNADGTVKLEQLDSYNPRRINVDLLAFNMKSVEDKSITASYTLLVENKGSYILNYEILAAKFMDDCMPNNTCYDCVYDLNITVTEDACGKTIFSSGPIKINNNNIDYTCGAAANYNSGNIELQDLEKGSYKIIKKLTVNEAVANQYVEHYINDAYNECTNVLEDMLLEELAKVDTTDCSIGCDDVDPVTEADWSEMLCDTMPSSPCEVAEMLMKSDFMPGGQYAKFGDDYAISTDPLSIFNPNNLLKNRNTTLPVTWELTVYQSTDAIELNGSMVYPGNLSIKDYVQNYDEKWADHFLEYHPEYCYLERCRVVEPSHDYDSRLQEEDSYANAKLNDWIDISNDGNQIYNSDPYKTQNLAQSGSLSTLLNKIQNFGSYNSGVSILDFAIYSVMCETNDYSQYSENPALLDNLQPGSINMNNCLATINSTYGSLTNLPIDTLDLIWQNYRSFYLSIKNNIEYVERTRLAKDIGCYNECIGQQQFNPLINQFWTPPAFGYFFDDDQICNINTYLLYKNKDKRFPGVYDILPTMDIDYYDPNTKIIDVWQNAIPNIDPSLMNPCKLCYDRNSIKSIIQKIININDLFDNINSNLYTDGELIEQIIQSVNEDTIKVYFSKSSEKGPSLNFIINNDCSFFIDLPQESQVTLPCQINFFQNGDFSSSQPNPGNLDETISLADFWSGIYDPLYGSTGDLFSSDFLNVFDNTNFHARFHIANYRAGWGFDEGIKNKLSSIILPNSGEYELSFNLAASSKRLHYLGSEPFYDPEVSIYGIYNPSDAFASNYQPLKEDLFGMQNTALLGKAILDSSYEGILKNIKFTFNSGMNGFPLNGITHIMILPSNKVTYTSRFVAVDDFILCSIVSNDRPIIKITDINDVNFDSNGNLEAFVELITGERVILTVSDKLNCVCSPNEGPSCRTLPEAHDFQSLLNNIHYSKHTVTGNTTTWNPSIQTAALGDSLKSVIGLDTVTRLRYPLNIRLENENSSLRFIMDVRLRWT